MTIIEYNHLKCEILKYINDKDFAVKDYELIGKEPDGLKINNFRSEFLSFMNNKSMKPSDGDIKKALDDLEIDGYLKCDKIDFTIQAKDDFRTHWKQYTITLEGKKYLRKMKQ